MQESSSKSPGAVDFKNCVDVYRRIVQEGILPSDRVADRTVGTTPWAGTIEELRQKWCDPGLKAARENAQQFAAPFRKELKGERLGIALHYREVFLPGGARTTDPHKMASASVWFVDFLPFRHCTDGRQIHLLRRYQFGPAEEMVKKTEQEYCGPAPLSAFQ